MGYLSEVNNKANFLQELNDAQRSAASHIDGPLMVIAGAGSGKTRVLTYRIAHLIQQGVDPFNILALTFTNKAAKEMKERISKLIGDGEARNIWMGTFHSIFARILRIEADHINYPRNFSIYDTADSKSLITSIVKEMGLDDSKIYKTSTVLGRISSCKNSLISPEDYLNDTDIVAEDRQARRPKMGEIYARYNNRLFKAGAMDFDDLLFKTNVLLRDHPEILHKYQHKFQYILVDEYQDTNFSQYLIVKQLAAAFQNVCVVGDDAQSIYAFRGADIQNILNFQNDYPDYALYKLEQNYRSSKTIVEAANGIISNNKDQIKKEVWTQNPVGSRIKVYRALTDNDEGGYVANQIFTTHHQENASLNDFAILYRTNAQSRAFEEAFRKRNIHYKIYGGLSFYQRKEVKDLIAYFRLVCNPKDEESFKRIVNYPKRGIGDTTIQKLSVAAAENDISIWEMIGRAHTAGITGSTASRLLDFVTLIQSFAIHLDTMSAYDLGRQIASESGLLSDLYADRTPEGVSRYENIEELLNGLSEFSNSQDPENPDKIKTLSDFLIDVALLTDADKDSDEHKEKVSLMTIHAAKGLEFPYVFIVGMEENLFPSQLSLNSREELEEERRLFYVALTRAEKQVTLSYADTRYRWGQLQSAEPSRFIDEIDEQYIELPTEGVTQKPSGIMDFKQARTGFKQQGKPIEYRFNKPVPQETTPPAEPFSPPKNFKKVTSATVAEATMGVEYATADDLAEGVEVIHATFGKGKVIKIEGISPDLKATIFFPSAGQKQLLLKFAKLKLAR